MTTKKRGVLSERERKTMCENLLIDDVAILDKWERAVLLAAARRIDAAKKEALDLKRGWLVYGLRSAARQMREWAKELRDDR